MGPRNYNNGKIYEIVNLKTNECLYHGYSTAKLTDIKKQIKFNIDNSKYRNIKKAGINNVEILLIENVNSNNLDELKTRYLNFILENPLLENPVLEVDEHHETSQPSLPSHQLSQASSQANHQERPQPNLLSQQPSTQANHHASTRANSPPSYQPNYPPARQTNDRPHLPQRQHYRPLQLSRDYSSLVAQAFDK